MSGSPSYHRSPPAEEEEDSPRSKRRRVGPSPTPLFDQSAEPGPSRLRSEPRRIPSHSPSGQSSADADADGEDISGSEEDEEEDSSAGGWSYELVVIQHPQRARACGFGDKDRRPLSPPPILRLYIRTASGRLVPPDKIPTHTLMVMVDLWSADSTQQRNVVMHPSSSSAGRPVSPLPAPGATPAMVEAETTSRPTTADRPLTSHYPTTGWGWSEAPLPRIPAGQSTGPSPHTRMTGSVQIQDHLPVPSYPDYSQPRPASSPIPSHHYHLAPLAAFNSPRPLTAPSSTLRPLHTGPTPRSGSIHLPPLSTITENLPPASPITMTIHTVRDSSGRPTTATTTTSYGTGRPSTSTSEWTTNASRPSWSTESSRQATDYSFGRTSTSTWNTSSTSSDGAERERPVITGWPPPRTSSLAAMTSPQFAPLTPRPASSGQAWSRGVEHSVLPVRPSTSGHPTSSRFRNTPASRSTSGLVPAPLATSLPEEESEDEEDSSTPTGGGNFSRVLVGSVCAICQRLTDENGNEGLFFFTHDLAVRTEGTFRLKFSLSDLSSLLGGQMQPGDGSAVLAQAISDPFSVHSAKKFPGVIPTTELTRLFASQHVRLPTRQKRKAGTEGEEGDEDEEGG
ncbi:velvet factor [Dioszegia hungarica]|uniref:Velvet factor n=1 Tax=Dioszegia hungarica TaxID=4972 RepID=A0AA38H1V5_9TREE|nr:velvet factor [Dioszegia hungarica]KAI9632530.1 velvet factor [Dioszegia hungarica]